MVMRPVRALNPVCGRIRYPTAPLPVPAGAEVSRIHVRSDTVADHPQVEPAETVMLPVAPLNGALLEGGLMPYSHGGGTLTVSVTGTAS